MTEPLRICIADDEPRMRDFLWTSLERLGHQVVSAARSGRELIGQCRSHRPDLVITDIKMPDMDGIAAAAEICRDGPVPVLLIYAFHDPELIERAKQDHMMEDPVKVL